MSLLGYYAVKNVISPIKYLGVPLPYFKLTRKDLQPVVDEIIKRIAGWRGRLLSYAGRLIVLKACLASIPIYVLSIIKFPKWVIKMMNSHIGHFLWNNSERQTLIPLSQLAVCMLKGRRWEVWVSQI